uniref:AP2/ERF domain-containing protein n=1 Tax=Octactis speculum TaxID=3111310 RepID=A0A7S2DA25_9STRA|mmetsp:Transcript_45789/g.62381  ORF Transcript_45789/g.62381 Transcript_45789/m.62381 type:complete len:320 (+) Transcript_45789:52-1011(+)
MKKMVVLWLGENSFSEVPSNHPIRVFYAEEEEQSMMSVTSPDKNQTETGRGMGLKKATLHLAFVHAQQHLDLQQRRLLHFSSSSDSNSIVKRGNGDDDDDDVMAPILRHNHHHHHQCAAGGGGGGGANGKKPSKNDYPTTKEERAVAVAAAAVAASTHEAKVVSAYDGVVQRDGGTWAAELWYHGIRYMITTCDTEQEAAVAHAKVAFRLYSHAAMEGDGSAVEWLRRMAGNQGHPHAQWLLGSMHEAGLGDIVEKDANCAVEWYTRAASQGHKEAESKLGEFVSCPPLVSSTKEGVGCGGGGGGGRSSGGRRPMSIGI